MLKTAGGSEQALPLLDEAQKRFDAIERGQPNRGTEGMAAGCFAERGACLLDLGRLDEAAAAYEENNRRAEAAGDDRQVAVGKGGLGTVRGRQGRYQEALEAHEEERKRFTALDEPGSVAVSWQSTGMVYQEAGQPEAAEDAYRKSLTIEVRLGNVSGQARMLSQLGTLYSDALDRDEDAAAFFHQAAEKCVTLHDAMHERGTRINLAEALRKLRRLDEARHEIRRAIECKAQVGDESEPWKTWAIFAAIETDAGNPAAAARANRKAIECYLAYRRDGGENHNTDGRICFAMTQNLLTGDPSAAASLLQKSAADPKLPAWLRPFIQALQAIVGGSRDRTLADAPDLDHSMAAEILFLLDKLEEAGK